MNIKLIAAASVVVFSAFVFAFSPDLSETEVSARAHENGKCAILPFNRAFDASAAVFVGEVVSEVKEGDEKIFEFEVERYWKGENARKVEIRAYESRRFQAWFKTGERYLVYASRDKDNNLRVSRCTRSREADDAAAEEDLQKLGEGKRPE